MLNPFMILIFVFALISALIALLNVVYLPIVMTSLVLLAVYVYEYICLASLKDKFEEQEKQNALNLSIVPDSEKV